MPKPKFDCVGCERENAVSDMVLCDACSKWWHFDCAGVSKEVKYVKWVCERCESGEKDEAAKVKGHEMGGKPSRATRGKAQSQDGDTSKTRLEKSVEVPLQQKPADQKLAPSKVSLVATPDIVMAQRSVRSETGTAPTNTAHVEKNRMASDRRF
ncbi:AGAP004706-PA [Anopheles gambiae str. PEST]|uniref:AGAP004706-PA n=1 Tax=Anopheles gambiae TaxID=7165 RepID=A7UUW2_ANOGA|nr:AGAP004706-PA [Anopheles gambiae str. PEST]